MADAEGLVFLSARSSDYGHAEVVYRFLVERAQGLRCAPLEDER